MPNVPQIPPTKSRHSSCVAAQQFVGDDGAVGAVFLDLPAIVDGDGQIVAPAPGRARDQRAHVRLGASPVVMDDVQHALPRRRVHGQPRCRGFAQRPQRIGRDVRMHHVEVVRMAFQQKRHVARPELGLLPDEGSAAGMHDERIVREHVAPSCARGAQAQVVLLAITRAEDRVEDAHRVEHRAAQEEAESDARRDVGVRRHSRRGNRRSVGVGIAPGPPRVVLAEARERADLRVVRERRDRADRRVGGRAMQERIQPAAGDDRVGVEQDDVRARQLHPAIGRPGEAQVDLVAKQQHLRMAEPLEFREVRRDGRIGRRVVDQHQAHVGPQMREHARHAGADIGRRVVHRHHHVGGVERHCAGHSPRRRCHQSRTRSQGSENHQRALCR